LRSFRFDRCWAFDADAAAVWTALTRTEDYRRWWPWLREFSGDGLVPGGRTTCVVRAPVPYTLRFTVAIAGLVPGERIDAVVDGDLAGPAVLEIGALGDGHRGSQVRLAWEMELQKPVLRAAARIGRPVMEWGHDWVVGTGFEQFCRSALRVEVPHDDHHDDRGAGAAEHGA
jgi:uncharacterized protein YndB with AHSA1/START domain